MKHHTVFDNDSSVGDHFRLNFENAPDRGMCYGGGGGGGGKGILRTVVTAAAVYYTGGLAASYFGAGTMAGVAAGAAAGGATAMGVGAVAGDGGEKNFGNFTGGAIGGALAGYGTGPNTPGAGGTEVAAAPAANGTGLSVPGDVAAATPTPAPAGLDVSGTPAATSDVVSQGAATTSPVTPGAESTAAVSQGAPAGVDAYAVDGAQAGPTVNGAVSQGTQTAGLADPYAVDGAQGARTAGLETQGQQLSAGEKIWAGTQQIPGMLTDSLANPKTQAGLGIAALSSAAGQDARDRQQAAEGDRIRAQQKADQMNADATASKNAIGDTLTTKANNYDPGYYGAQAGAAYKMGQDKSWADRKQRLIASGASPDQIAAEERRSMYNTSLGAQTAYQDTFGKTQATQNNTYGQAAGAYGTFTPQTAGLRTTDNTPGTAKLLEDTFNIKRSRNADTPNGI